MCNRRYGLRASLLREHFSFLLSVTYFSHNTGFAYALRNEVPQFIAGLVNLQPFLYGRSLKMQHMKKTVLRQLNAA